MDHESDGDTSFKLCTRFSHQRIDKGTGGFENKRTGGDHPNDCIIKIWTLEMTFCHPDSCKKNISKRWWENLPKEKNNDNNNNDDNAIMAFMDSGFKNSLPTTTETGS